jgi:hypothetical protein
VERDPKMLNVPRELLHMPLPGSNVNLPAPRGTRLVARRLNAEDSARLRAAAGRGPTTAVCNGRRVNVSVRRLGATTNKTSVVVPMKGDAYKRLIAGVRAGQSVPVAVPTGANGTRLVTVRGGTP